MIYLPPEFFVALLRKPAAPKLKCIGGPIDGKEVDATSCFIEQELPSGARQIIYTLREGAYYYDLDGINHSQRICEEIFGNQATD